MKDGKITLRRAVNCYKPCKLEPNDKRFKKSQEFFEKWGFHYEENWSLDGSAAYYLLIHLVHYRDNHMGIPGKFCHFSNDGTYRLIDEDADAKRWSTQLDKMIRGLYMYLTIDFPNEKEQKIIDKGFKLLFENFSALWD